jgi:tetratricopeptide (TPR) repeat protein
MNFWPFKRKASESLTPTHLRTKLIETAASGSSKKLRELCQQYKQQIAANVEFMCKAPDGMPRDAASLDRYVQCLGAVAQCLASECGSPELWNRLCGTPDNNPLMQWEKWFAELPQRMDRLEYDSLIAEARDFIARAKTLEGTAARQNEAFLLGRLGELLFHSGRVREADEPWRAALKLCEQIGDAEGERVYLNNLLELYRYLGDATEAVRLGEELVRRSTQHGIDCGRLKTRLQLMRRGEPLCRVVCVREGKELELDEIKHLGDGAYQFQFCRNRLQLHSVAVLMREGNEIASSGQLADALEKYQAAAEIDPQDPDPVFQSGVCLLELGAHAKAREAFEEVERLAPGWFRCRTDRWLAESLENGTVTDEEFRVLRALEDGGLAPTEASNLARQAVARFPEFAPLYLVLGDLHREKSDQAVAYYRKGLQLAAEPDLQSRLLCALAGLLPKESPERSELVRRALSIEGSLVAKATAAIMGLQ